MNPCLTPAAHRMLLKLRDGKDKYAISEGAQVWVDSTRFTRITLEHLLCLCLVSRDSFSGDTTETWILNEEGRNVLESETYIPLIAKVQMKGRD